MQLALYRAERPEVFEDIIGQKHIVRILQNQIKTGTVSQAYLFSGTHGTGKTSTARILAKAVNCLDAVPGENGDTPLPCGHCENCMAIKEGRFVDCIELDAASNNGVDDLRSIIEMVKYPPTVGRYKVYIIDEVHMLSQAAENAFLKTLEEPPKHAIFILATTDPQKVRSTIRSRCMQLNFKRVSEEELVSGMERICNKRNIETTRDALLTIASRADGSVRDALSILEQCTAAGDEKLDRSLVLEYTGAAGDDFYIALTDAVRNRDVGKVLIYIDEIAKRGKDSKQILKDWLTHYRNLMVVKFVQKPERIIASSNENLARLKKQADTLQLSDIERAIKLISEYINIGRYSENPRILLETAAVRLSSDVDSAPSVGSANRSNINFGSRETGRRSMQSPKTTHPSRPAQRSNTTQSTNTSTSDSMAEYSATASQSSEVQNDEPIEMIASAPREQAGDPIKMWNRITEEMTRDDRSFMTLVGKHGVGTNYDDGELTVVVRPGKIRFADDKLGDITRTAKSLYGLETFVTLHQGDPDEYLNNAQGASEQETSEVIDSDIAIGEMEADIEAVFGMKPVIKD